MKEFSMFLFFVFVMSLPGCMTDRIENIENRLFKLQTGVFKFEQDTKTSQDTYVKTTGVSQRKVAGMTADLDELHSMIRQMRGGFEQLRVEVGEKGRDSHEVQYSVYARLDVLAAKIKNLTEVQRGALRTVEKLAQVIDKKSKKSRSRKPMGSLSVVKKSFSKKKYSYIVQDMKNLLKKVKKEEIYELKVINAESLFKLGKIREAALAFNEISEDENYKIFFPKINLRLGDCFRLLGDKKVAILYYDALIESYPETKEASYAKSAKEKM